MITEDIKRVFFHELGHFVAREINHLYYSGQSTKSIDIYPHELHPELFLGDLKVYVSNDGKGSKVASLDVLPEYLASSTYGCFFQSYYQRTSIRECLDKNGTDDMQKWITSLMANGLDWLNSDIASCDEEYFKLLNHTNKLDELMKLKPENYLIDNENMNYSVDIDKLRKDTSGLIEKHYLFYKTLVDKYIVILNEGESFEK